MATMHTSLARQTDHTLAILFRQGGVGDARGANGFARTSFNTLRRTLHLLDLVGNLLGIEGRGDVGCGSGQKSQNSKSAILLILLKATAQTAKRNKPRLARHTAIPKRGKLTFLWQCGRCSCARARH